MIVVDTNIISEALKQAPDRRVIDWFDNQPIQTLYLSAVTVAELKTGIEQLPAGKRKDVLKGNIEERILPLFANRVLPFDVECTERYAQCIATAKSIGRGLGTADAMIAATALSHGYAIATRDTDLCGIAGLTVINPWHEAS